MGVQWGKVGAGVEGVLAVAVKRFEAAVGTWAVVVWEVEVGGLVLEMGVGVERRAGVVGTAMEVVNE